MSTLHLSSHITKVTVMCYGQYFESMLLGNQLVAET